MVNAEGFEISLNPVDFVSYFWDGFWLVMIVCFIGWVVSVGYRMISRDL